MGDQRTAGTSAAAPSRRGCCRAPRIRLDKLPKSAHRDLETIQSKIGHRRRIGHIIAAIVRASTHHRTQAAILVLTRAAIRCQTNAARPGARPAHTTTGSRTRWIVLPLAIRIAALWNEPVTTYVRWTAYPGAKSVHARLLQHARAVVHPRARQGEPLHGEPRSVDDGRVPLVVLQPVELARLEVPRRYSVGARIGPGASCAAGADCARDRC